MKLKSCQKCQMGQANVKWGMAGPRSTASEGTHVWSVRSDIRPPLHENQ